MIKLLAYLDDVLEDLAFLLRGRLGLDDLIHKEEGITKMENHKLVI
jgi:hypothetical protein